MNESINLMSVINQAPFFEAQASWSDGYNLAKNKDGGVVVGPGGTNPNVFIQTFPVLHHRYFHMVAIARSANHTIDSRPSKGLFQINWLDSDGKFISTSQQRFEITEKKERAEANFLAPENATTGVIYVAPGGKSNIVEYYEMSLFFNYDPPPPLIDNTPIRFPSNLIHLSDPYNWEHFDNLYRGYDEEAVFKGMIRQVIGNTMVTYDGLLGLLSMVRYCETSGMQGDYVEVGSWRGGCSGLMALGAKHYGDGKRQIRLYDSFQGLPQPIAEKDFDGFLEPMFDLDESNSKGKLEPINALVASEDDVRNLLFERIGYPKTSVSIYKGWFQDTIPSSKSSINEIAILRLDGDFYDSYKVALEHLYPKVVKGGFVIIDDWALGGCRKAVTEYFEANELQPFFWSLDITTRCFQRV